MTMRAINVSPNWALCPKCGGSDVFVNQYGVHHCRNCLSTWEHGLIGGREGYHRISAKPTSAWGKLEEAAEFYGYTTRRFHDQVRKGKVLGIRYEAGRIIFHSELNEVKGPLADKPQQVLLPPGTRAIDFEVCSGSTISGRPYVIDVKLERDHPFAILKCEDGYSGAIVQVILEGSDVEPVDYTESQVLSPDI